MSKNDDILVYVGSVKDTFGKKFMQLCESVQLKEGLSVDDFRKAGFTNHNEPNLYFCRIINTNKHCPVSFSITVDKETLKIIEFALLDENFLQPCLCNEKLYQQSLEILRQLKNKGILVILPTNKEK